MKGVSFTGKTARAGKLLDKVMSKRLGLIEKMTMKVEKVSDDPVTYEYIPKDKRILRAWRNMTKDDIELGFIVKVVKNQRDSTRLASEFKLEVI